MRLGASFATVEVNRARLTAVEAGMTLHDQMKSKTIVNKSSMAQSVQESRYSRRSTSAVC